MEAAKMELDDILGQSQKLHKQVMTAINRIDEFLGSAECRRNLRKHGYWNEEDDDDGRSEHI
jgi:hypothetical protein